MLAEVAGPDQRAAKKMRPGHCTKKSIPGVLGWSFLGLIHSFTKVSHPCWKYICSRAIVHLRQTRLAQANYMFQSTCQNEKKSTKGQPQDTRDGCSQAMKSRFCKTPKDRCFCWFPAAIFLPLNETPTWRLHAKLYKFG